jgi:hypothetical protein
LPNPVHELEIELARSFDIFLGQMAQFLGNFKLRVFGHVYLLTSMMATARVLI